MPNSLRTKISKLRYKGEITQQEYDELIKKLDGHDKELLDKVAEHIEEIYKCNLYCAEDYCDKEQCQNAEDCFYGAIVKAIERMKAEIEE